MEILETLATHSEELTGAASLIGHKCSLQTGYQYLYGGVQFHKPYGLPSAGEFNLQGQAVARGGIPEGDDDPSVEPADTLRSADVEGQLTDFRSFSVKDWFLKRAEFPEYLNEAQNSTRKLRTSSDNGIPVGKEKVCRKSGKGEPAYLNYRPESRKSPTYIPHPLIHSEVSLNSDGLKSIAAMMR